MNAFLLLPLGVGVGVLGSLIGVGGGFFVVPFLLLATEGFTKESATAASLGIVLLSSLSATAANAGRRRVDWSTGTLLALGSVPGAWAGRELIGRLADRTFTAAFGVLLLAVAAYLIRVRLRPGEGKLPGRPRELTDREGQVHRYRVNAAAGLGASVGVGLISSLFGIGGGLLLVPFLAIGFGMSMIVAAATAQFCFVWTAAVGLGEAVRRGQWTERGTEVCLAMGLGVVLGAQLGVALGKRVPERGVKALLAAVIVWMAVLMLTRG
jgi:uncharacterized membrane protein YfcA